MKKRIYLDSNWNEVKINEELLLLLQIYVNLYPRTVSMVWKFRTSDRMLFFLCTIYVLLFCDKIYTINSLQSIDCTF